MSQEKPQRAPLRKIAAVAFVLGLVQKLGRVVRDCVLTGHVGYPYAPTLLVAPTLEVVTFI